MKNFSLIFILSLFFCNSVIANVCKQTKFPFSDEQTKESLIETFNQLPKNELIEFLFFALDHKESKVLNELVSFLISNETKSQMRGFFKSIRWALQDNGSITSKEACALYKKALLAK